MTRGCKKSQGPARHRRISAIAQDRGRSAWIDGSLHGILVIYRTIMHGSARHGTQEEPLAEQNRKGNKEMLLQNAVYKEQP